LRGDRVQKKKRRTLEFAAFTAAITSQKEVENGDMTHNCGDSRMESSRETEGRKLDRNRDAEMDQKGTGANQKNSSFRKN